MYMHIYIYIYAHCILSGLSTHMCIIVFSGDYRVSTYNQMYVVNQFPDPSLQ